MSAPRRARAIARGAASRLVAISFITFAVESTSVLSATDAGASANTNTTAQQPAIVVVGGAWGPEGNQASLETQVEALRKALGPRASTLLFAAGDPQIRSVQVEDNRIKSNDGDSDEATERLGLVFARFEGLFVHYRPSKIKEAGMASKAGLLSAIRTASRSGSDVVVFAVGHGAPATEDAPAALELWGADDQLYVDDLAAFMDRLSSRNKSKTAFVLGHCHSGAFADVMFEGGDNKRPIAHPARCVFAAVPKDREAAGCTPDVNDPSAQAYMSQIAHALGQRTVADFDGDGRTSLAEAHAYAKIQDPTIDLPVSTSELWLEARPDDPDPKQTPNAWTVADLLKAARPTERAVLTALGSEMDGAMTVGMMALRLDREKDALEVAQHALDETEAEREQLRRQILNAVLLKWPELSNPYHPVSRRMLGGPDPSLMDLIKKRPELEQIEQMDRRLTVQAQALLRQEKQVVQKERWLRTALYVAREHSVRRRGRTKEITQLDAILACESMKP